MQKTRLTFVWKFSATTKIRSARHFACEWNLKIKNFLNIKGDTKSLSAENYKEFLAAHVTSALKKTSLRRLGLWLNFTLRPRREFPNSSFDSLSNPKLHHMCSSVNLITRRTVSRPYASFFPPKKKHIFEHIFRGVFCEGFLMCSNNVLHLVSLFLLFSFLAFPLRQPRTIFFRDLGMCVICVESFSGPSNGSLWKLFHSTFFSGHKPIVVYGRLFDQWTFFLLRSTHIEKSFHGSFSMNRLAPSRWGMNWTLSETKKQK